MIRVLLNGVGRIGKAILRISLSQDKFKIVAINELNSNKQNIAYSINYDSTYGRLEDKFVVDGDHIINSTHKIAVFNNKFLSDINFEDIDLVIEASGSKVDVDILRNLQVKNIFLTHPVKEADINVVLGVNETTLDINQHKIISTSSCNATALLPLLKIVDENFDIYSGDITTIHPLLNHQKTLDSNCVSKDDRDVSCNFEFGRSSTQNIIPSRTTTVDACSYVLSQFNHNLLSSNSFRVPTVTVGAINVVLNVSKNCSKDGLIKLFQEYEQSQQYEILVNNFDALVSSDFAKQNYTTIIDHRFTDVKKAKMIKLVIWYDNEWGYASKVVDIVKGCLYQMK